MKHVTLSAAMGRAELTQLQLEKLSGVDRTRISRLLSQDNPNPTIDTYDKLVAALRQCGALKANERLVFGQGQGEAVAS